MRKAEGDYLVDPANDWDLYYYAFLSEHFIAVHLQWSRTLVLYFYVRRKKLLRGMPYK